MRRCSAARELGVAPGDFGLGARNQRVEQVVGLHALALPARHVDEPALVVRRVRRQIPERARGGVRERHHLVREMGRPLGLLGVAERPQRLLQQLLQIRLPDVDDVVGRRRAAERRMRRVAGRFGRRPQHAAIRTRAELAVVEIAAEQPELPELVRDVLADVGDGAVRSDDDLLALFVLALRQSLIPNPRSLSAAGSSSSIFITQQPASLPSV